MKTDSHKVLIQFEFTWWLNCSLKYCYDKLCNIVHQSSISIVHHETTRVPCLRVEDGRYFTVSSTFMRKAAATPSLEATWRFVLPVSGREDSSRARHRFLPVKVWPTELENELIWHLFQDGVDPDFNYSKRMWLGCNNTNVAWVCLGDTPGIKYRNGRLSGTIEGSRLTG